MNFILCFSHFFSEQVGLSTLSPTPVSSSVLGRPISAMSQPVTSSHNGGYYQNMQHTAAGSVGSPNGMIPTPFTQSASSSALPNGNLPQHHQQQLQQQQQEQYYWNQYQT